MASFAFKLFCSSKKVICMTEHGITSLTRHENQWETGYSFDRADGHKVNMTLTSPTTTDASLVIALFPQEDNTPMAQVELYPEGMRVLRDLVESPAYGAILDQLL